MYILITRHRSLNNSILAICTIHLDIYTPVFMSSNIIHLIDIGIRQDLKQDLTS